MTRKLLIIAAMFVAGCGTPREWVRCTAHHPVDGRCTAWLIGPHFKD